MVGALGIFAILALFHAEGGAERTVVASQVEKDSICYPTGLSHRSLEKVVDKKDFESCANPFFPPRFTGTRSRLATDFHTLSSDGEFCSMDVSVLHDTADCDQCSLQELFTALETGPGRLTKQIEKPKSQEKAERVIASPKQFEERWEGSKGKGWQQKWRAPRRQSSLGDVITPGQNHDSLDLCGNSRRHGEIADSTRTQAVQCPRGCKPGRRPYPSSWSQESSWCPSRSFGGATSGTGGPSKRSNAFPRSHQQAGQTSKATDDFVDPHRTDGQRVERLCGESHRKIWQTSRDVSSEQSFLDGGISQEKSGNPGGQARSPASIHVSFQCTASNSTASGRGSGCRSTRGGGGESGCIHGNGRFGRRGNRGHYSQEGDQNNCIGALPTSGQTYFTFQSPCRAFEAKGLSPWDLSPEMWKRDIPWDDSAQVDHDMSDFEGHPCLVDTCEVPCPCDRWCTERVLPCNEVVETCDSNDLERLLHSGPQRIYPKQVRFNDHPEIIIIDEGVHDDGSLQDGAVGDAIDALHGVSPGVEIPPLAVNSFSSLHESSQADHFWAEFHSVWTPTPWFPVDQPYVTQHISEPCILNEVQDCDGDLQEIAVVDSSEGDEEENANPDIRASFYDWEAFVQWVGSPTVPQHGISVITYGLRHVDIGCRKGFALSLDSRHLCRMIWTLWQDLIRPSENIVIHLVWPQPSSRLNEPDAIVFLIEITTDHKVSQDRPVLMLSIDHTGAILEGPFADYVEWSGGVDTVLQVFRRYEWCRPNGFREYQLSCGGHQVQFQNDKTEEIVINHCSLCLFVLGELPFPFQQASEWFDNYERFARIALNEHVHGRCDFVMRILGVETCLRTVMFPYRDILHPHDLLLQMIGARQSSSTDIRFSLLPHTDLPLEQDGQRTFYVLEYDSGASFDATCVFITQVCHPDQCKGCDLAVLRIPQSSTLPDIHQALCLQHGVDSCQEFSFLSGSRHVEGTQDLVDGMVFKHFVNVLPGPSSHKAGSSCSIGDIPAEARLLEQMQILADEEEANAEDESSSDEDTPVSFHNWNDLAAHVDVNADIPSEGVRIITFGLRGVAQGRRDTHAHSLHPRYLRRLLWDLWQDVAARFEDLEVYFVLPQPCDELQAPGAIVLVVEIYSDTPSVRAPILSLTWDETAQTLMVDPHAMFLPGRATRIELLQRLPFGELCLPIGMRMCSLSCGLRQVMQDDAATLVPIGRGYLCKLRIPGKSDEVMHAEAWFSNFERFAMTLLAELPDGKSQLTICVHHLDGSSSAVPIACANVHQPAAIIDAFHAVSGSSHVVYRFIDNMDVHVAHARQCYDRHIMEIDRSRADSITILVVTIVKDDDRISRAQGTQVHSLVAGHSPWPEVLHMRLCADYELSSDRHFMFYIGGRQMDRFDALTTGQVIVHQVQPSHAHEVNVVSLPAGYTEANVDLRSASQAVDPPLTHDHEDSQVMSF